MFEMEMIPDDLTNGNLKACLPIIQIARQYPASGSRVLKLLKREVNQT